jgi:hypothetical protein
VFISADYGKDGGGVIEAITKSGSNQLHGSLFELHRDAAFDAKTYFDLANLPTPPLEPPDLRLNLAPRRPLPQYTNGVNETTRQAV